LVIAAVSLPAAIAPTLAQAAPSHARTYQASTSSGSFVHGVLPPPPAGSTTPYNVAAEPQIRASQSGRFYISSENGLGAGTDAWASSNNGGSYSSLPQPNAISAVSGATGLAPGGGDTDLAVAPVKNGTSSTSQNNVYVASLTLGDVTVSGSQDGGKTWQSNELSATVPGDDREWIAAAGASGYDLSYHAIAAGNQIIVNQGGLVNGVPASVATYDAINPAQPDIYAATLNGNEIGNIAVDQRTGDVYQVFVGCPPGLTQVLTCSSYSTAYMAVGTPTGVSAAGQPVLSFTDYVIHQGNPSVGLDNNFPTVAVDAAGNVYAAWSDDHNVSVSYSTSHGQKWSAPVRANSGSATTAIYPWLAAGQSGKVDLVYYGTPAAANYQTCSSTGTYTCQNEPWHVYFAQNLSVLGGGHWAQQQATGVVHYGGVCQGGVTCSSTQNDNRDLYDDFGVAASPTTGLASITYSDDQHADNVGTANAGECTAAQTNSVSCDHTDYATQVSGSGIG
jgi:hypothetical protein